MNESLRTYVWMSRYDENGFILHYYEGDDKGVPRHEHLLAGRDDAEIVEKSKCSEIMKMPAGHYFMINREELETRGDEWLDQMENRKPVPFWTP